MEQSPKDDGAKSGKDGVEDYEYGFSLEGIMANAAEVVRRNNLEMQRRTLYGPSGKPPEEDEAASPEDPAISSDGDPHDGDSEGGDSADDYEYGFSPEGIMAASTASVDRNLRDMASHVLYGPSGKPPEEDEAASPEDPATDPDTHPRDSDEQS